MGASVFEISVCWPAPPTIHRGLEWPQFLNSLSVLCLLVCSLSANFLIFYSTVRYSTVQYGTFSLSAAVIRYSTVHYSMVQYSTVQYSTVQYITVQYSKRRPYSKFIYSAIK